MLRLHLFDSFFSYGLVTPMLRNSAPMLCNHRGLYTIVTLEWRFDVAQEALGRHCRVGMTMREAVRTLDDNDRARQRTESIRWPDGPRCPHCRSCTVQAGIRHPRMTHRCRDCADRPMFTVMQGTGMPCRTRVPGPDLHMSNIRGVSSLPQHRQSGITPEDRRVHASSFAKGRRVWQ
ncbi:MAG: transposase [Rhodobacteraceae bacterium]|nr:transposase [Paracoccaceae bacterium]